MVFKRCAVGNPRSCHHASSALGFCLFLFLNIGEAWDGCRFFVAGEVVFVCFYLNIGETGDRCRFFVVVVV